MYLTQVINFLTDKDMQASAEVRIAMDKYLRELDGHLISGYVPNKTVQESLDDLCRVIDEFEEELVSGIGGGILDDNEHKDDSADDELPEDLSDDKNDDEDDDTDHDIDVNEDNTPVPLDEDDDDA